jgi:NTE family protein
LINWGYAVTDTALRTHFAADVKAKLGITIDNPVRFPYPVAY